MHRYLLYFLLVGVPFLSIHEPAHAYSARRCFDAFIIQREVPPLPEQLTIMTYNVENLQNATGGFQRLDRNLVPREDQLPYARDPNKSTQIRDIINEVLPDIMVLSEVESLSALRSLAQSLKEPYHHFMLEGNDSRQINISFLIKSRLPLEVSYETHRDIVALDTVTNENTRIFTRDAPAMVLTRPGDSTPFLILVGVHAKSQRDRRGDSQSIQWRSTEFHGYMSIVNKYRQQYGDRVPVFLLGDFNTNTQGAPEMAILKNYFQSAFDMAPIAPHREDRITHTFHPKSGIPVWLQMDDVLIPQRFYRSVLEAHVYRYLTENGDVRPFARSFEERQLQPSDHLPVFIKVSTRELNTTPLRRHDKRRP